MNKTININLGGFFFHIDEIAYQVLKHYLASIAKSLNDDPKGKNEIIADIEARISELLSEQIKDSRQVINESDINNIIKIMGQPEDYGDHEEVFSNTEKTYEPRTPNTKKLYRDIDDKFLGGVASGLSHYVGIDSIWIRLAFILLFIFGGFGFPIYIILWVVLPEARTTAEKLEMEGEAVNIDNIEKKIRTEFSNVSDKIKNADYSKAKTGFQNFLDTLGKIILAIFNVIGKFIGVLLLFVASAVLILLTIGIFSFGSMEIIGVSTNFTTITSFIHSSLIPHWTLAGLICIAIGFPFLILLLLGLRIISSSVKRLNKPTSLTLFGIWIIAILALIFTGIEQTTADAFQSAQNDEQTFLYQTQDTLRIKIINNDNLLIKSKLRQNKNVEHVYDNDIKKLYSNYLFVDVIYNDIEKASIKISKISTGQNRGIAKQNAEKIEYNYTITDNTIELNGYFLSPMTSINKNETVTIVIALPLHSNIHFTNSTKSFLGSIETTSEMSRNKIPNHTFIMQSYGLECTDCED